VVRGDDHLNNAARQLQIIRAMGWPEPAYGHLPLIHGPDGAKLSKRHGALAVEAYRDMGYLPQTMRNYLLRLGWSHGDDEIIPTDQAIAWFDLRNIGRSPARLDFKKLDNLNAHYMRAMDDAALADEVAKLRPLSDLAKRRLSAAMPGLKERAKTIVELAEAAAFLFQDGPPAPDEAAQKILTGDGRAILGGVLPALESTDWSPAALEAAARAFADAGGMKLGQVAQPLRAALTGRTASPPLFDMMAVLGREESLVRLMAYVS
ncbi:MAG: glutamate--tRNA ligase, partial [Alphaproteobacteria bacterium]|nr:glutamate--tRNA ligase [Alphaproteobacteria bacterium]